MKDHTNISKNKKLLKSQDYKRLLDEGRHLIEKLSNDKWTDYNTHDPGITILEVLCYALTELGYKTAHDIENLLIERGGEAFQNVYQFYTARQILCNKPVTLNDYREILIDIEGVKNAWLSLVDNRDPAIYVNCTKSLLIHEKDRTDYPDEDVMEEVKIRGLYDVTLELGEDEVYGDLNELYVEKDFGEDTDQEFEILADMPSWSTFFKKDISADDIVKLQFNKVTPHPSDRKRYIGELGIKLLERTFKLEVEIYSTHKASPERNAIVEAFLKKQGKTSLADDYLGKLKAALSVVEKAYNTLHAHRNLCEDYDQFKNLEIEKLAVCADIEVENGANNEQILAEIYYQIERFIAPFVNFYSFEELADKGKRTEDIFEGPALNHGFIDADELSKSEPKTEIMVSDLIQIIMDVDGVLAVKNINLASRYKNQILNTSQGWCIKVKDGLVPRFVWTESEIILYKENLPYYPVINELVDYLNEFYTLERQQKLSKDELYDFPVPDGSDMLVDDYYTIQEDFPATYGVGSKGIPGLVTEERKAQSKQLRAYLLLFDQLIANYIAQLYHVKALFSFSSKVDKTYFYKILYDLPKEYAFPADNKASSVLFNKEQLPLIYHLVKDFVDKNNPSVNPAINLDDYQTFETEWENYKKRSGFESEDDTHFVKHLDAITEDIHTFHDRRNRFLDHIGARFAEQFSDYVLLMSSLDSKKAPGELIDDKIGFLQDYPIISSERGKAFNYKDKASIWNTENVAGLKKRVSRLLGIDSYMRSNMHCDTLDSHIVRYKDDAGKFRFNVHDNEEKIILQSHGYSTAQLRNKAINLLNENAKIEDQYFKETSADFQYYFNIKSPANNIIASSIAYPSKTARDRAINRSISLFKGECNIEGFHLVEHLLLRPLQESDYLMEVCVDSDCQSCPGNIDPYSFRISLIIPYWPKRFDNMAFRRFFEKTVRLETPAHIHSKICWASEDDMILFEKAYKLWLSEKSKRKPDAGLLSQLSEDLIVFMNNIRSVYPVATLHDCYEGGDENIVVLNQSILGTFNPDKDGID